MYQKASETGWFYHAPARPPLAAQVGAPPPSQIPGLSELTDAPPAEPPPRSRIMESDSKYVRLAKQGGREDLLMFNHMGKKSEQAQGYPRVDWFYLEDIRAEEAEKQNVEQDRSPHQFMLPEYMVHEAYNPTGSPDTDTRFTPKRAPYGFDQATAFERDSRPTDKTVRLPEMKRDGYGIRAEKLKDRPIKHNVPVPQRGKPPQAELTPERKVEACVLAEDERPMMSKILSFGYARDWNDARDKWQTQQGPDMVNPATIYGPASKEKPRTEYQAQMAAQQRMLSGGKPHSRERGRRGSKPEEEKSDKESLKEREKQKEKELFKMARFANVKARTNSHRVPAKPSSPPWGRENSGEPDVLTVNGNRKPAAPPPWALEVEST